MLKNESWRKHDFFLKLIVIGDPAVGKSQLIQKFDNYCSGRFANCTQHNTQTTSRSGDQKLRPQINRNIFCEKELMRGNKKTIIRIVDTGGQERYRSLTASYYRGAHGCLILYDVTQPDTFQNVSNWYSDLQEYTMQQEISIILVGTKCNSENRRVPKERAEKLATEKGIPYIEVSAKDGTNVNEVFEKLADMVIENFTKNPSLNLTKKRTFMSSVKPNPRHSWCSC